jgi:site-specific DNA-adenine methylase
MEKPLQTYYGSKHSNGTYQQIINNIPACETFIDAMVGNGGIVTHLKLPSKTIINDIDPDLMDKYSGDGRQIIKENLHVLDLIDKYDTNRSDKVFFYFDPPYLFETRKDNRMRYAFDWNNTEHINFLTRCLTIKSNCMISHAPCNLYDHVLKDWNKVKFWSNTRGGLMEDCIYMNYSFPEKLQDYRYIGNDYI